MTLQPSRREYLLIPLILAALTACHDSVSSTTAPREVPPPRLSVFPGDNGKLAFVGVSGGIHTINPDGTGEVSISTDGAGPAWSPNGAKLAFYSAVDGNNNIYVMNADGSARTQLTFYTGATGVSFPAWSPDGSKIAFQNDLDGRLYVMNADGTGITQLTTTVGDFGPNWSPDGTRIAFTTTRHGGITEIYVMNADGTNQIRLTDNLVPDYDPSWSPDGSRIIFTRDGATDSDIFAINPDGSGATNLTQSPGASEASATWSPDGAKVAFIATPAVGSADVYVMNVDGTGRTNLTNSSAMYEFHLDWQPRPAAPVCVFGPTVFTRGKGSPVRTTQQVSATPGSYIVDLDDLGTTGADAIVKLNGVIIMDGRGTTGEVGPRHYTVPVTLAANNVLEVEVRGKKESVLQVKICAAAAECYPDLPAPALELESVTVESGFARFELNVTNYAHFPDALFAPAPDLPACGLNTSASRTWVDIYNGDDGYEFGFCSLGAAADMNGIYFVTPVDEYPAEAYVVVHDRRCNQTYTSNRINLAGGL